ncbi:Krueppel homolog 1-like [Cololabis saira]|uniref:Krueppel homolog 1-like n=1 Tax=Cololabis saira TaxID=129043 RepID=UPI002AD4912B|nr:Krueppel homolog 1-like [Cololabis saira]
MKIHTGERPYLCNTFNKPFTKSSALKSHIITHMGEKPYIFKTCGKSYRERSKLVIHSRIHTGEKPYICKTCGKSYRLRSTLVVHSRTHTGESPSLCNTCGKTFTKSSHLNCHITTHTDELIGVEYLYKQTGKVLQDYNVAIEQSENNVVQVDESFIETEEFVNMTLPSLETVRRPAVSQSSAAAPIPPLSAPPSTSSTCLPAVPPSAPSTSSMSLPAVPSSAPSTSSMSLPAVPPSAPPSISSTCLPAVPPSAPSTSSMSLPAVPPSATASPLDSLLMAKSRPAILPATQCSPTQQPSSGAAAQASEASSSHDDSVGPDNIEGYGAVQDLAEFLVGLRHHRLALSGEEANQVITLWQMLGEYDKRKTIYPIRHRTNLSQGRLRATKKIVAPGVESTKRSFIGAHSPAQWPDCNRVVEAVFLRLCALYPNAVHCDGKKVSRFTMMARLYKHIRECVITNSRVMSETTIQLPEVNAATLTQW